MDSVNYFIGYLLLVLLLYPCDEGIIGNSKLYLVIIFKLKTVF